MIALCNDVDQRSPRIRAPFAGLCRGRRRLIGAPRAGRTSGESGAAAERPRAADAVPQGASEERAPTAHEDAPPCGQHDDDRGRDDGTLGGSGGTGAEEAGVRHGHTAAIQPLPRGTSTGPSGELSRAAEGSGPDPRPPRCPAAPPRGPGLVQIPEQVNRRTRRRSME